MNLLEGLLISDEIGVSTKHGKLRAVSTIRIPPFLCIDGTDDLAAAVVAMHDMT